MYQGRTSVNTLDLVMEEQGFLYSADSYADELPYWVSGPHGPQLIVPYTLDANDMRFATPQGFNSGDQFFAYLKDSFDVLYAEGKSGQPKMMSVGLHCRLAGRPGTRGGARPLPRLRAKPRSGVGRHPPGHRAPLDRDASAGRRLCAVAHAASLVRRAVRHCDCRLVGGRRGCASHRPRCRARHPGRFAPRAGGGDAQPRAGRQAGTCTRCGRASTPDTGFVRGVGSGCLRCQRRADVAASGRRAGAASSCAPLRTSILITEDD